MKQLEKSSARILIIEDEVAHAEAIDEGLTRLGHQCTVANDGESGIALLSSKSFDIIITDLMLGGDEDGLDVLAAANEKLPAAKVILVTAHSSVDTCRTALQQGAFDYIEKPLNLEDLRAVVSRACEVTVNRRVIAELRRQLDGKYGYENIVAHSSQMVEILDKLHRVAAADLPVLILGQSGTGKELMAKAIHQNSRRKNNRFVAINCAGLSQTLLEDELFGHVKGAYTGADAERVGRFEHAHGGTLFLDEIGDMPADMQAKLLRVLENGEVIRVGSNEPVSVDVRIVSATNSDLASRVEAGEFRQDLYFRIKGATIEIPPLCERREDIPVLIDHFIRIANENHATKIKGLTGDAKRLLMAYPWPGNVRQLRNVIENMVVLAESDKLTTGDLPAEIHRTDEELADRQMGQLAGISLADAEKELIRNTLKMVDGNRRPAADILGIGERTLYRKIKEYGLNEN